MHMLVWAFAGPQYHIVDDSIIPLHGDKKKVSYALFSNLAWALSSSYTTLHQLLQLALAVCAKHAT